MNRIAVWFLVAVTWAAVGVVVMTTDGSSSRADEAQVRPGPTPTPTPGPTPSPSPGPTPGPNPLPPTPMDGGH
jgi:hypothetical protein